MEMASVLLSKKEKYSSKLNFPEVHDHGNIKNAWPIEGPGSEHSRLMRWHNFFFFADVTMALLAITVHRISYVGSVRTSKYKMKDRLCDSPPLSTEARRSKSDIARPWAWIPARVARPLLGAISCFSEQLWKKKKMVVGLIAWHHFQGKPVSGHSKRGMTLLWVPPEVTSYHCQRLQPLLHASL